MYLLSIHSPSALTADWKAKNYICARRTNDTAGLTFFN